MSEVAGDAVDASGAPSVDVAIAERRPAGESLMTALRHALDGHGSLAVVHGDAGIGKTTLIHAVADSAATRHPELRVLGAARAAAGDREWWVVRAEIAIAALERA